MKESLVESHFAPHSRFNYPCDLFIIARALRVCIKNTRVIMKNLYGPALRQRLFRQYESRANRRRRLRIARRQWEKAT